MTTLLDAEVYPLEDLAELYGTRWRVEQHFRNLKQTIKMDVLHCKSVDGFLNELMVYANVHNLVRLVMKQAACRQRVEVERISFIGALRWLLEAQPGGPMPRLVVNTLRPERVEPRVRKRRPKEYPVMKKPRHELRKALLENDIAA